MCVVQRFLLILLTFAIGLCTTLYFMSKTTHYHIKRISDDGSEDVYESIKYLCTLYPDYIPNTIYNAVSKHKKAYGYRWVPCGTDIETRPISGEYLIALVPDEYKSEARKGMEKGMTWRKSTSGVVGFAWWYTRQGKIILSSDDIIKAVEKAKREALST